MEYFSDRQQFLAFLFFIFALSQEKYIDENHC